MTDLPSAKLLVISVDALHGSDLDFARTLPGFAQLLDDASIAEVEGVFPSVTYPNHATQITGCAPDRTGIYNNQLFQPQRGAGAEWFWDSRHIAVPTIFAAARKAGLTTAAVQWPVTANEPDVDWLVPEIASPWLFDGFADQYRQTTNTATLDTHILPNLHRIDVDRPKGRYLRFVRHVATEILTQQRPDVMFVHLVDVDFARHAQGAEGPHVQDALRAVDESLCDLLSALADTGDRERTNIVIVSDHGQLDVVQRTNLNALFRQRGLLRVDEGGDLVDYDVFCHSSGLSGQLFAADDLSDTRRAEVEELLAEIEADPVYRIERIWTTAEARERYRLDGPFDWVVESEPGVAVGTAWNRRPVVLREDPDFTGNLGAHGHAPHHGGQPVFVATGPGFVPGLDLGRRSMLDEAPTFAAVLGIELPDATGSVMRDVLTRSLGRPQMT